MLKLFHLKWPHLLYPSIVLGFLCLFGNFSRHGSFPGQRNSIFPTIVVLQITKQYCVSLEWFTILKDILWIFLESPVVLTFWPVVFQFEWWCVLLKAVLPSILAVHPFILAVPSNPFRFFQPPDLIANTSQFFSDLWLFSFRWLCFIGHRPGHFFVVVLFPTSFFPPRGTFFRHFFPWRPFDYQILARHLLRSTPKSSHLVSLIALFGPTFTFLYISQAYGLHFMQKIYC